jgi:hypothetical protein
MRPSSLDKLHRERYLSDLAAVIRAMTRYPFTLGVEVS